MSLHEYLHMKYWQQWWSQKGYNANRDLDADHIPDDLENGMGLDPKLVLTNSNYGNDLLKNDEEYLAYKESERWVMGSADAEDWACPGHQWKGPAGVVREDPCP